MIKVTNEKFLRMGEYLDTHAWLGNVVCYLCSLVTYFLYFGAVCKTWVLPKKHALITLATATIAELLEVILPSVGCYLGTAIMILLPYIFGADYRQVAIVFTLHYVGQLLLLNIRQLPMFLIGTKSVLSLVLLIDNYYGYYCYICMRINIKEISNGEMVATALRKRLAQQTA